jgi:zinc transport system substrate-binding protein
MRFFVCLFTLFFPFYSHAQAEANKKPIILVSLSPYREFAEQLAGDAATVTVLVPQGANSHTYEPRPRQILELARSAVWFRVGDPIEDKLISSLRFHNPAIRIIDLRTGLNLIKEEEPCACCCKGSGYDPHIWLSPRLMIPQVKTMAKVLGEVFPNRAEGIAKPRDRIVNELIGLDKELTALFAKTPHLHILVNHPAFGYMARDYHFTQLTLEIEGKELTPRQLTQLLQQTRQLKIREIFVQPQNSRKGADVLAEQLPAKVVEIDPMSEHYISNMRKIGYDFAHSTSP